MYFCNCQPQNNNWKLLHKLLSIWHTWKYDPKHILTATFFSGGCLLLISDPNYSSGMLKRGRGAGNTCWIRRQFLNPHTLWDLPPAPGARHSPALPPMCLACRALLARGRSGALPDISPSVYPMCPALTPPTEEPRKLCFWATWFRCPQVTWTGCCLHLTAAPRGSQLSYLLLVTPEVHAPASKRSDFSITTAREGSFPHQPR